MPKNDQTADILRGWPGDGALDQAWAIKSGSTLVNGDVVEIQTDGTVDKVANASEKFAVGLVVRGNGDTSGATFGNSSSNSGKAVVLWSNYVVRIKQANWNGTAPTLGAAVSAGGSGTGSTGCFRTASAGPGIGFVAAITPASTQNDATYTLVIR